MDGIYVDAINVRKKQKSMQRETKRSLEADLNL